MAKLNILLASMAITLLVISVNARLRGPDDDPRNTHFSLGTGPSPNEDNNYDISTSARLREPDDDPKNTNFSLGAGPSPKENNEDIVSASARLRGPDDEPRNGHFSLGIGPSPNDDEEVEAGAPSPYSDDESWLAQEPYPGFFAFVDTCIKKLTDKCGKQLFSAVFEGGEVSNKCCGDLVDMGKKCHTEILKATTILPFVSKELKKDFEEKDAQVWYQCVSSIAS